MRRQCKLCPWKVSTDPREVPGGYDEEKHRRLTNTIAADNVVDQLIAHHRGEVVRMMACHESPLGDEVPCVGWLHHQLGDGNNIILRLNVSHGRVDGVYELDGEQHPNLEATFPK